MLNQQQLQRRMLMHGADISTVVPNLCVSVSQIATWRHSIFLRNV